MITYFYLRGYMVSGKNSIGTAYTPSGKKIRYPNARFVEWRNVMSKQIWQQKTSFGLKVMFDCPVRLTVTYTPQDRIQRDATGILDAIFHLLEYTKVLSDDALVKEIVWKEQAVDKSNSHTEICLMPI